MYDKSTLNMINELAKKNNFYILCDDVYESLCYKEKCVYPFDLSHVIFLKSFSKTYGMTGYRLGYIIANDNVVKELLKVHSYLNISVPVFIQKAGVEALDLKRNSYKNIKENLSITYDYLNQINIPFLDVDGGIFIFIDIREFNVNSIEFCDMFLSKYHVACVPGICFKCEGFIRVNFAIKKQELITGLNRLEDFVCTIRNSKKEEK